MRLGAFVCGLVGHELGTSVHADRATLYCFRCRTVQWWYHEETDLIISANCTAEQLAAMTRLPASADPQRKEGV